MPNSTNDIVLAARSWVGTPYHHGAQLKGVGVDCVGVILGVGAELGYFTPERLVEFRQKYGGYARTPNPARMRKGMLDYLRPLDWRQNQIPPEGSIGWFQWRENLPMHLAIVATFDGRRTMIHAFEPVDKCVENSLDELWLSRVNSWWQYNGAEV